MTRRQPPPPGPGRPSTAAATALLLAAAAAAVVAITAVATGRGLSDNAGDPVATEGPASRVGQATTEPAPTAGERSTAGAPPAELLGLTAALEQSRAFTARRMMEVVLRNAGGTPARVLRLQLRTPLFEATGPTIRHVDLAPGDRRDVPIKYGSARCDGDATETAAGSRVDVTAVDVGGETRQLMLALPEPEPLLARLHADECTVREITSTVTIAFGSTWRRIRRSGETILRGSVDVRRHAFGQAVTVHDVAGTVIFTLRPRGAVSDPLVRLGADVGDARIPVEVSASRCDPHALMESKKTYLFPAWVSLGDAPAHYLTIEPAGQARRLLEDQLAQCGEKAAQ